MKPKRKHLLVLAISLSVYFALIFLLLTVEKHSPESLINNLYDAIWYSFVTFSTVGYGEYYPVTVLGRLIGLAFIVFSVTLLGLVIGRISSVISEMRRKRRLGLMGTSFKGHVIVLGWDSFTADVVAQLYFPTLILSLC